MDMLVLVIVVARMPRCQQLNRRSPLSSQVTRSRDAVPSRRRSKGFIFCGREVGVKQWEPPSPQTTKPLYIQLPYASQFGIRDATSRAHGMSV